MGGRGPPTPLSRRQAEVSDLQRVGTTEAEAEARQEGEVRVRVWVREAFASTIKKGTACSAATADTNTLSPAAPAATSHLEAEEAAAILNS